MLAALILLLTLRGSQAYPNVLPHHQQEIIPPLPGTEVNDKFHTLSTIRDVLLANQIIPQVLDDFEPTYYVDISYPKHHERVLLGNDIPVKSVSKRPVFTFFHIGAPPSYGDPPNESNSTFTLILTDPDALSRDNPVKSEMCHWILTNLTTPFGIDNTGWPEVHQIDEDFESLPVVGSSMDWESEEDILKRKKKPGEIESYFPPAPPKKTGPHRYVFVLLEGDATDLTPPKKRPHWGYGKERHGVRDWAAENNLTVVGANFFLAEHKKQK